MPVKFSTLVDVLLYRALYQPDEYACTFLKDGQSGEKSITYKELDAKVRAIASTLQASFKPGERALLLFQPGLDFITAYFACLYSGIIAVPVYPPHPSRLEQHLPKLLAIINDAQTKLVLTTSPILNMSRFIFNTLPATKNLHYIATDLVENEAAAKWMQPEIENDDIAFLQYTSGSTTTPRGVMVSHGNLMYNLHLIKTSFEHTSTSQGVIWLPPYHDMGLIGGILQPIYCGFHVALMSPMTFLQRPFLWLQAISTFGATTSGGPNFAYDLCIRKITPEQRATLDLSSWDVAFNGAEPINYQTLERFAEYFKPCGFRYEAFYNCYGLAEATLLVSGGTKSDSPVVESFQISSIQQKKESTDFTAVESARTMVGCGQTMAEQNIVVVNPHTLRVCDEGKIGEIWISGPSVAKGYWNQGDETKQTFGAYTNDTLEGPFLRSGDLGFLKDGELFVAGRLKDIIIIDGQNHFPQDIELTVEQSHKALRVGCCAAFSENTGSEEQLIVVVELDATYQKLLREESLGLQPGGTPKNIQPVNMDEVAESIRRSVAEHHDLRVKEIKFLKAGSIPKTSSGKVQRYLCKEKYKANSFNILQE